MKKTIDADIVETFVSGVLHSLDLLEFHLKKKNLPQAEIELINVRGELRALAREIEGYDPTYRIHEYRDTGRTSTEEDKPDEP